MSGSWTVNANICTWNAQYHCKVPWKVEFDKSEETLLWQGAVMDQLSAVDGAGNTILQRRMLA